MGDPSRTSDVEISEETLAKETVILAQGKNMFGDEIYSYIKFSMKNFRRLRDAMIAGENFKPSDYGEVIAAGRGEPPQELKDEMRIQYGLIDTPRPLVKDREPEGLNKPAFFEEDDGF